MLNPTAQLAHGHLLLNGGRHWGSTAATIDSFPRTPLPKYLISTPEPGRYRATRRGSLGDRSCAAAGLCVQSVCAPKALRSGTLGRSYISEALLDWLSQDLEAMAVALGPLIQQPGAMRRQGHLLASAPAAPDHADSGDGMVGGGLKLWFTPPHSLRYNWAHALEVGRSRLL